MARRRGAPSNNSLSPPDPVASTNAQSPGFLNFPRSASPSTGFTQFLSKPTKWFNRSSSGGASGRSSISSIEPRSSTSSGRKPKISHPTDPRPILDQLRPEPSNSFGGMSAGSRSVLDLSLARTTTGYDGAQHATSRTPSSPSHPVLSRGLGDLRSISRKPWSKSADDLGKVSSSSPALAPIDTTFYEKIDRYRNERSGSVGSSNAPSPSTSPSSNAKNYPFPSIATPDTASSSPPHRLGMMTATPSPVSATPPLTPTSLNSGQVHSRSHSFTPRLPSKLSAPKLGLVPPSPKRRGSASSEQELNKDRSPKDREREKPSPSSGSLGTGPSPRAGFPFGFGAGGASRSPGPSNADAADKLAPPSALLAPPTIIEPGDSGSDARSEKRGSQVIYHAGFINRLTNFSPAALNARANHSYMTGSAAPVLAKGWKPSKLVLKGSKLYFYKLPNDRATAIKDLFPTELVVMLDDADVVEDGEQKEMDAPEEGRRDWRGRDRDDGRKKRVYWGRDTHPSLVHDKEIQQGSFESLVHEAVFATTFIKSWDEADDNMPVSHYRPEWQEFSSTILLCLPSLVGRARFEPEFFRYCSLLVDGADAERKEEERTRVYWMCTQYLSFHGDSVDSSAWDQWRNSIIPNFPVPSGTNSKLAGIPESSSMQALFTPSPVVDQNGEFSPNLGTFSPRPEADGRLKSILDAFTVPPPPLSPSSSLPSATTQSWRAALEKTGFSRDVLFSVDVQLVARSLLIFNQSALKHVPDNLTADCCLGPGFTEVIDVEPTSAVPETTASSSSSSVSPLAPFLGTDEHPHWLTKMILVQILISDTPAASARDRNVDDRPAGPPRVHSRSEVISAWARIGDLCRRTGDECSWRAIYAALCSRPIARLDKVWKRVDMDALRAVQAWVHPPPDGGDVAAVGEPKTVPWAGDRVLQMKEALEASRVGDSNEWKLAPLAQSRSYFESLRRDFSLCPGKIFQDMEDGEDVVALVKHWQLVSAEGASVGIAAKLNRIDQFMSMSLAAEPRRKGLFEPHYWARIPTQSFHPLLPLSFPEPLPVVTLINRAHILRSRLESSASSNLNIQDIQLAREPRSLTEPSRRMNSDGTKMGGLDLGGTIIVLYDGELMLAVQPGDTSAPSQPSSRAPSRPPSSVVDVPLSSDGAKSFSRNPSIRVKPGSSHGLDRKPSQVRRNSLPSISRRTSLAATEVLSERPIRVVVQAGTLERLVEILVEGLHGVSVSVADDNGEMPLNDKKTRELRVDNEEYANVWWSTFRSFVTPHVFFELLRKRYLSATVKAPSPSASEIAAMVRVRSEVLETMHKWVGGGGGAQDALDDAQLYASFLSFLTQPADHAVPEGVAGNDAVSQGLTLIHETRKALLVFFTNQTRRPSIRSAPASEPVTVHSSMRMFGSEPPDIDHIDAEELVSNLDAMASATFRNVAQEDLFVTADILEIQSADRIGWFLAREPSSISDEVEIQCIHSYLHDVEPSTMISELGQDSLYRLFPPAIRGCIRAFGILRKWLVSKLVASGIGLRARQARIELMLQAVEVCRLRNADAEPSDFHHVERPCVRSFVEAILTSAVLSVESRLYQRAWQGVASGRGTTCDTLSSLLSKPTISSVATTEPLTVDIGWLLERMLEVISLPDVQESLSQGTHVLANLEKRRSLYGLLTNTSHGTSRKTRHRSELNRQDFERLNRIEQEVNAIYFDLRGIREDAHREFTQTSAPGPLTRRTYRPFQSLVAAQQEKNKRDKSLRDRLSREKRQEQQRQDKREEYLNKAMHPRRPMAAAQKQHRNKKSVSSAFLQFMRPISSAFTSDTVASPGIKRTPAELDFTPSGKPLLVLSVAGAQVSQFINNERSFTFQLNTEDGGHYLLQCIDKTEMKKWVDTIDRVSKTAAKRRLTYLGQHSKVQMSDHLLAAGSTSRDPRAVFGVDLESLVQREATDGDVQPSAVPSVIERLIAEVDARGLTEIGIYRIAGAHSEIGAMKDALNRGEWPIDNYTDIHAICDLIKAWFRVIPGGMFSGSLYPDILQAAGQNALDLDSRLANIRHVVHSLPRTHFNVLRRLIEHLDKVTDFEEQNQMTAESLATVFSPNLLRSSGDDVGLFFANMSAAHRATKLLINHFHTIFDSIEPDVDVENDGDSEQEEEYEQLDEPILEEDEEDADAFSADNSRLDEEETQVVTSLHPPVLDVILPDPQELSIALLS